MFVVMGGGGVEFRLKIEIAVSGRVFYAPPWNFPLNVRATSGGRESRLYRGPGFEATDFGRTPYTTGVGGVRVVRGLARAIRARRVVVNSGMEACVRSVTSYRIRMTSHGGTRVGQ